MGGSLAIAACATGREEATTFSSEDGAGGDLGQGGDGQGASSAEASSTSDATSSGAGGDSSTGAGGDSSTGAGGDSSTGAGAGGSGGTSACDYSTEKTCFDAEEIPSIAGDKNNETRTLKGTTSAWFNLFVREDSSNIFGNDMSFLASLDTPPGMQFQLFLYEGNLDQPNCQAEAEVAPGVPPTISKNWSDSLGSDDDQWFTLEVRYVSGEACNPAPEWTLTVIGHKSL